MALHQTSSLSAKVAWTSLALWCPFLLTTSLLGSAMARAGDATSTYTLTREELALDCGKLTGRIAVRIRQLRSARADAPTSMVGRGLQSVTAPLIGGTKHGIDRAGDEARDLAMLKAYNARLAEKRCPTFDLAADLAPGNTALPRPVRPAKSAPKPAFGAAPAAVGGVSSPASIAAPDKPRP
jgi:hypothetical protein